MVKFIGTSRDAPEVLIACSTPQLKQQRSPYACEFRNTNFRTEFSNTKHLSNPYKCLIEPVENIYLMLFQSLEKSRQLECYSLVPPKHRHYTTKQLSAMRKMELPCKSEDSTHTARSVQANSYVGYSSILLDELAKLAQAAVTTRNNPNNRALPVAMGQISTRLSNPTIPSSGIELAEQTNLGAESGRLSGRQPEALTCARTALTSAMQLLATQMELMAPTANMQGSGIPTLALASGVVTASEVLRDLPALLLTSAEAIWEAGERQSPSKLLTSALSAAIEIGNARWPGGREWPVGRAVLQGLQNGAARI